VIGFIKGIIEIFLHLDKHLDLVIRTFGNLSYLLFFLIVFAETGLVITPFLPGDSLLFATGAFAAIGYFNIFWLFVILSGAAIIGDSVNYFLGQLLGENILKKNHRLFNKEHVERTHKFYEKYGGKTIILARFVPIIRTFAPFVAGVGKMNYSKFILYNITGGLLWVGVFALGGYYFGNIPFIKNNFSVTILVIVFLSVLPVVIEFWKHRSVKKLS
jgi:membrane-associated protein